MPDLTGRIAVCGGPAGSHAPRPSSTDLPLFVFTGPGSVEATDVCGTCRYHRIAHVVDPTRVRPEPLPITRGHEFTPIGPQPFDKYACLDHLLD